MKNEWKAKYKEQEPQKDTKKTTTTVIFNLQKKWIPILKTANTKIMKNLLSWNCAWMIWAGWWSNLAADKFIILQIDVKQKKQLINEKKNEKINQTKQKMQQHYKHYTISGPMIRICGTHTHGEHEMNKIDFVCVSIINVYRNEKKKSNKFNTLFDFASESQTIRSRGDLIDLRRKTLLRNPENKLIERNRTLLKLNISFNILKELFVFFSFTLVFVWVFRFCWQIENIYWKKRTKTKLSLLKGKNPLRAN